MIILEGVDKAGKTTLANRLAKETGFKIKKSGIPDGNPIPEYIESINNLSEPLIWDRFVYGEIPYSIVKKRKRYMEEFDLLMLELMMMRFPVLTVYVRPSRETIVERIKKEGDDYIEISEAIKLYDEYDELMPRSILPVFEYRGSEDYDKLLETIQSTKCLDQGEWLDSVFYVRRAPPGVGTVKPKYVFVADRLNNKDYTYRVTLWSRSGAYLFAQLRAAGIRLQQCYFVNAFGTNFEDFKFQDLKNLPVDEEPIVVALGVNASDRLTDEGIEHNTTYHPAFWSRFHIDKSLKYQEMLRNACGLLKTKL